MSLRQDLITQCQRGNASAQKALYHAYRAQLMGLCRRYTRSREEAQEVLQDSFVKIFKKINQLGSADKLESWMKAIVVRTAIDYFHKTKVHHLFFVKAETESHDAIYEPLQDIPDEYLVSIVNELPDGCRIVFNMFVVEGYSHTEIAEMLNITEGTSRSQLHYAKVLLKEKLKSKSLVEYYEKLA